MPDARVLASTSEDHLRLMLGVGQIGVWELDVANGGAWRNSRHDEIFGYGPELETWTYDKFLEHVVPDDRATVDRLQKAAIANKAQWSFECRIVRVDGEQRWISASGRPLLGEDGSVTKLIGHVIDITPSKANEERLQLLTNELNHRVRNMLAMIRAMVSLSSRKATDIPSFAESLEGRVAAMARTHDLLSLKDSDLLGPAEIIELELDAFSEFRERIDLRSTSSVNLQGARAEAFSLVIHELITNAIKHGALSNDSGRISVTIEDLGDGSAQMVWTERGGPPPALTGAGGFGTRMIDKVLNGHGDVTLDFQPAGLVCVTTFSNAI